MDKEWLRPKAMQELIFEYRPDLANTLVPDIQVQLAHGFIRARAKLALLRPKRTLAEVRAGGDNPELEEGDWPVPQEVWRCSLEEGRFALPSMDQFRRWAPVLGFETVKLIGLSFSKTDLIDAFEIELDPTSRQDPTSPTADTQDAVGKLPSSAKPLHRACAPIAERVAEIISERGCLRSVAIREALDQFGNPRPGTRESNERAVRATFDLMFNLDGSPI